MFKYLEIKILNICANTTKFRISVNWAEKVAVFEDHCDVYK